MKIRKIFYFILSRRLFATNRVENALNLEGPVTLFYPIDTNMEDIFSKKQFTKM
jgi:hypothetical protein